MYVRPAYRGMTHPDPSYATGRGHASFPLRAERAHGHGACAAAGGRDCQRQTRGTGRPTLFDVARARSLAVSLLFRSFFLPFFFCSHTHTYIHTCIFVIETYLCI